MGRGLICTMCDGTCEVYGSPCPQCMDRPWHGSVGGYTNHGCRCNRCGTAWRQYHRQYQRRWRASKREAGLTARGTERKRKAT